MSNGYQTARLIALDMVHELSFSNEVSVELIAINYVNHTFSEAQEDYYGPYKTAVDGV